MTTQTTNENGTALQSTNGGRKPLQTRELLMKAHDALKAVLPAHLDANRIIRMANFAVSQDANLLKCHPTSILTAVMRAAALGLDVGGVTGHAYLVPFKGKVQLVVGYKGHIELALRGGKVISIEARAVYDEDEFDYELGLVPFLKHKPKVVEPRPENITHAYAVARFPGGSALFEVLNRAQIEGRRARSASAGSSYSPWNTDYEAMARKSAVQALANYVPQSPELAAAIELGRREAAGDDTPRGYSEVIDVLPELPEMDAAAAVDKPKTMDDVTVKLRNERQAAERVPGSDDDKA